MLNKILIQWFRVDVTTKALKFRDWTIFKFYLFVVYFDQRLGAAHSKHWSKYNIYLF